MILSLSLSLSLSLCVKSPKFEYSLSLSLLKFCLVRNPRRTSFKAVLLASQFKRLFEFFLFWVLIFCVPFWVGIRTNQHPIVNWLIDWSTQTKQCIEPKNGKKKQYYRTPNLRLFFFLFLFTDSINRAGGSTIMASWGSMFVKQPHF